MANEMKSLTIGDSVYSITQPINIIHSTATLHESGKKHIPNLAVSPEITTTKYITNVAAVLDAIDYMYETRDCSKYMVNFDDNDLSYSVVSLLLGEIYDNNVWFTRNPGSEGYPVYGEVSADDGTLIYYDKNRHTLTREDLDENGGYIMLGSDR